ncbi:MAG TPA: hypothetical protein VF980_07035 [Thermoanaerobaculia bacterium]
MRAYLRTFFGYGQLRARYWFIGLEEGGVRTLDEFLTRLDAWSRCGQPELVDLASFHHQIGVDEWFRDPVPLQRTWRALMRARFAAEGVENVSTEQLRRFQARQLGSSSGDTALLELLPLPARGRAPDEPWIYQPLGIADLASRERYIAAYTDLRRDALTKMVRNYQPRAVVTYGDVQRWRTRLGADTSLNAKAWTTTVGATVIVCSPHPEGARANAHWDEIGRYIRATE